MKSQLEKLEGLRRKLQVEVPYDVVNAALEKMYKDVQKMAKFKGFREGKAPMNMIKTEYKQRVELDVADQIIRENYSKALNEHSLEPVNFPQIDYQGFKDNEPLKFTAIFEVRPEVKVKKFKGLEVEKEKLEIKTEVIEKIIEDIRASKSKMIPVIEVRPAQMGDVSVIDFEGQVDGKPLEGGSAKEYTLELGSKQFIPGFEEGIVGMSTGAKKVIKLKFPENYQAKDIAGKDVEFTVTLLELKKKVLPDLDDEFAKSIGQHESMDQLREEIKKDVSAAEEKRVKDEFKNKLLHALVEANSFEVPQSMMAEQKQIIIEDVQGRMKNEGMSDADFEDYKAKWDSEFDKSAEFVIKSSMLINAIAKEQNIMPGEIDFQTKLEGYAKQTGIELEKIKAFYNKPESRSRLMFQMTEDKVLELLTAEAKIKEVPKEKLKS